MFMKPYLKMYKFSHFQTKETKNKRLTTRKIIIIHVIIISALYLTKNLQKQNFIKKDVYIYYILKKSYRYFTISIR